MTAEYDFEIRLTRDRDEQVEGLTGGKHEVEILIEGESASRFEISRPEGRDHSKVDAHLKARLKVPAGAQQVAVTFVKKPDSILETKRQPYDASIMSIAIPVRRRLFFKSRSMAPMERKS